MTAAVARQQIEDTNQGIQYPGRNPIDEVNLFKQYLETCTEWLPDTMESTEIFQIEEDLKGQVRLLKEAINISVAKEKIGSRLDQWATSMQGEVTNLMQAYHERCLARRKEIRDELTKGKTVSDVKTDYELRKFLVNQVQDTWTYSSMLSDECLFGEGNRHTLKKHEFENCGPLMAGMVDGLDPDYKTSSFKLMGDE